MGMKGERAWSAPVNTMEELRELLAYVKPELVLMPMNRQMCLMDDLQLTDCDALVLVALIEARSGRVLGWERPLETLGDLLDYLASQGVEMEEE